MWNSESKIKERIEEKFHTICQAICSLAVWIVDDTTSCSLIIPHEIEKWGEQKQPFRKSNRP